MNLSPPSSQKAGERPISFLLDDESSAGGGGSSFVDLVIRPEDLTRASPSRVNVQQTLGGAWADSFGAGVDTINISGHTGWRRTESDSSDGVDRFLTLKDTVFTQWHQRRDAAATAGQDPNGVRLVFSDALDGFSVVVAPMSFTLRRSKSRPLLAQYQITMAVLDEDGGSDDPLGDFINGLGGDSLFGGGPLQSLGLDSLSFSMNQITGFIAGARSFVNRAILGPVQQFMGQTARLCGSIIGAINSATGMAGSLINVGRSVARAGVNLFRSLAAGMGLSSQAMSWFKGVASAYTNIYCVLNNALRQQVYYQDYSDIYGASNCSSTAGGRPISALAGENPFYSVVPTRAALPVTVTTAAQIGLRALGMSDPVLAPLSAVQTSSALIGIAAGLVVA